MRIMKRAFPVVCIMAITLIMSLLLYGELLEREESKCWKELSNTTQFVNREITTKFQDDIAAEGEYLTSRIIDFETGNECVYYVLPVIKDDELGNAYETGDRKKVKGYEDVDLQEALKKLETGVVAFESHTTGKPMYMYFTPIGMFDWQLSIFAEEDVIFGNLLSLRKVFIFAGIAEAVLLILYFFWNISTVRRLEKSYAEIEKQKEQLKYISYIDMLTSMYNRNKYTEVWDSLKEKNLKKVGVAYIDLNGLKQINDSQSHEVGDNYIRNAAKIISNVFVENCYRIGGDEFVILVPDIAQDEFIDKIATLKESMLREQISVSTGFLWEECCSNVDELLKEAERQMYEDKENYYLTHDRRRQ